jgi:hypothetical protein
MTTTLNNGLRAVQSSGNVDLAVGLGSYSLSQWNTAVFKINNALNGLQSFVFTPSDASNYNYYYFKTLNVIMAQKKSANNILTVNIGSTSSALNYQSTFGLSWVYIFNNYNAPTTTNPYTLYTSTPAALTLTTLTSYAGTSLTLI